MVDLMIPYFGFETDVAFLGSKGWVFRKYGDTLINIWLIAFFIHVFTSIFTLIAGFTQFFKKLLWSKMHRLMGKIYIFTVLVFAAPSGFVMGFFANGKIVSIISFTVLSLLWWYFTYRAYTSIRKKDFSSHSKFMYRSYALALSAITLRLWKYIIVNYIYEMPPMDLYKLVGIMGWTLNLIVAEILIWKGMHLKGLPQKSKTNQE
jgi:uncharacterized membrane protein